jgi:hypothetical protein
MEFLQQAIALLSEPPGSVIYHLVTLFALQVVFAISFSRWRHNPDDAVAQRLMSASAAIFAGRIILLFIGLVNSNDPQQAAIVLPPLEQAVNMMTIALLVWSLIPQPSSSTHLFNIILVIILVLSSIMYLFFAQVWQNQISGGVTYYNSTLQATIWTILEIIILMAGLAYLLRKTRLQEALPAIILIVLLLAAVAYLFNQIEFIQTDTNIPYMLRFGFLVAFPLWAVYAYQYTLTPLLDTQSAFRSSATRFGSSLNEAAQIISTNQVQRRIAKSINMASDLLEADFVAIGLINPQDPLKMRFTSSLKSNGSPPKSWTISLSQQSAFTLALTQGNTIELLAEGLGARQLYEFYRNVGIEPKGPLLIHPLIANERNVGLLVAGAPADQKKWPVEKQELMPGLANYQAQAILNSQTPANAQAVIPPAPGPRDTSSTVPSAILLDQVQLHGLRSERDNLRTALEKANLETKQAEARALAAQKQARYLAAALKAAQQSALNHTGTGEAEADTIVTGTNKRASSTVNQSES